MIDRGISLNASLSGLLETLVSLSPIQLQKSNYLIVQVQLPMPIVFIHTWVEPKNIEKRFFIIEGLNESLDVILRLKDLSGFINIHPSISIELKQVAARWIWSKKPERCFLLQVSVYFKRWSSNLTPILEW